MKKCLVISAVNIFEGGPLTVLRECLASVRSVLGPNWRIVIIVHSKYLINQEGIDIIELPKARKSAFNRLYYEFIYFHKLSLRLSPDIWFSLHDISPFVNARRQVVYCHNPLPFWRMTIKEVLAQPKIFIYSKLYGFLYGINIKKNNHIIVQQSWLRAEFEQIYGLHNVVVAHPCGNRILHKTLHKSDEACKVFLYPAFPRVFKNFEILGDAAIVLREMGITGFEVRFTISGKENSYSRKLYKKYHKYDMIKFIGTKTKAEMDLEYINCHAVVFPSLLETWGLPITEAKSYNKKLIVSDLPYAHETVANYDSVSFFNPKDSLKLAYIILGEIQGKSLLGSVEHAAPIEPYMESWNDLIRYITKES